MAPRKVLVVDDDDDMRALVAGTLRADGLEVMEAEDGEAALELLGAAVDDPRKWPDVVLMDVKMPKFSGLGVLSALQRAQLGLRVVMMTALLDESVRTVAKRFGAVSVLQKPFGTDELRKAMKIALALPGA
jgi:DNA-binding response OmpR family regulator